MVAQSGAPLATASAFGGPGKGMAAGSGGQGDTGATRRAAWPLRWARWLVVAHFACASVAVADDVRWIESTRLVLGVETRLRLLSEPPPPADRAARPYLVAIVWTYPADADPALLPAPPEALRLVHADALLEDGIERSGIGLLAAAMTGGLQHEWLFYTSDPDALAAVVNRIAPDASWPVQLLSERDARWETYRALRRHDLLRR
jgi:hypothetical protein